MIQNWLKKRSSDYLLDLLGFYGIGIFSFAYINYVRSFAELNIQLPFLDFPVFIGELLLICCTILLVCKYKDSFHIKNLRTPHWLILFYSAFVCLKAVSGYFEWGPLALRHSALFYYPIFAVFGFCFFRRGIVNQKMALFIVAMIAVSFATVHNKHWTFSLVLIAFILIRLVSNPLLRILMMLMLFISIPYRQFLINSRMMILGNFIAALYLACSFSMLLNRGERIKVMFMIILSGMVIAFVLTFANRDAIKSIVAFDQMKETIKHYDAKINEIGDDFQMEVRREVKLYNPDSTTKSQTSIEAESIKREVKRSIIEHAEKQVLDYQRSTNGKNETERNEETKRQLKAILETQVASTPSVSQDSTLPHDQQAIEAEKGILFKQVSREIMQAPVPQSKMIQKNANFINIDKIRLEILDKFTKEAEQHDLTGFRAAAKMDWPKNANSVFRIMIWRDMFRDLLSLKPLLGFDFGKPFRSKSLEALDWGTGDWARDGWIEPHNSFLHIIYRGGIIGFLFIGCILLLFFRMILRFVRSKSITGILLCGIIMNWFCAANFLVTLELPYTAIPIWSIFGITVAYCYKARNHTPQSQKANDIQTAVKLVETNV